MQIHSALDWSHSKYPTCSSDCLMLRVGHLTTLHYNTLQWPLTTNSQLSLKQFKNMVVNYCAFEYSCFPVVCFLCFHAVCEALPSVIWRYITTILSNINTIQKGDTRVGKTWLSRFSVLGPWRHKEQGGNTSQVCTRMAGSTPCTDNMDSHLPK